MSIPKLSVIIPAYNEEKVLAGTLTDIIAYLKQQPYTWEIIVVDDGSTDNTAGIAREFGVNLLQHSDGRNYGKGAAVRLGLLQARGEYRLFTDADNSTSITHIEKCWPLLDRGYSIVIGSRALPQSVIAARQPRWKELVGKAGNLFIQFLVIPGITDTQAGFKLLTAEAVKQVVPLMVNNGWVFDVELLAIARCYNHKIAQIPITWVNYPESKVKPIHYFKVLGEVVRIRWNLLRGRYNK